MDFKDLICSSIAKANSRDNTRCFINMSSFYHLAIQQKVPYEFALSEILVSHTLDFLLMCLG